MKVTINNFENAETLMLNTVLVRLKEWDTCNSASVDVTPRKDDGYIKYVIVVTFEPGSTMTIIAQQRGQGAEITFYS